MTPVLHVSRPASAVVMIEIDAPPANALGHGLRLDLEAELDRVERNLDVRCLVLTGRGKGFCAGDDLREAAQRDEDSLHSLDQFGNLLDRIETLRVPVIAAVNGHAIGGGLELALCCDIRIGSADAWFLGAGVNVGLMASVHRLPRLIGVAPAKAMLLTGLPVDSQTAQRYGLLTDIHPGGELIAAAVELGERIATRAPLSVEASKRMINRALDMSPDAARAAIGKEVQSLVATNDHKAGARAVLNRQPAVFTRS